MSKTIFFLLALFCIACVSPASFAGNNSSTDKTVRQASLSGSVKDVLNAKNIVLEDGTQVRLAALQAPNLPDDKGRPGDPLAKEAAKYLYSLVAGKILHLKAGNSAYDAKGRLIAQAYLEDGSWVQELMLQEGWAMVYSFNDQLPYLPKLLSAEGKAIAAKRNIWAHPAFSVLPTDKASSAINHYRVLEGKVVSATLRKKSGYLNFTADWRTGFSARIDASKLSEGQKADWEGYSGKIVQIRGWIYKRGKQTVIDLALPENILLKN